MRDFLLIILVAMILVFGLAISFKLDKLIELCTFEEEEQIIFQIDPQELSFL